MFEVSTRTAPIPTYVLKDTQSGAEVEICPTRGGMATRFVVGQEPIFAMDDSTLYDLSKNVRGGNPVLFPAAGPLKDNTYHHQDRNFEMKQHGFARNVSWEVTSHSTEGAASLTLTLRSSEATQKQFPFAFEVAITYSLQGKSLKVTQEYRNTGDQPLPLHAGFHPYFYVSDAKKGEARVSTGATRAFDNVTKQEGAFSGFDLTQKEVDLHLKDHGSTRSVFQRPGLRAVEIAGSEEFTHWVVWTLTGKDFVCVEPWTAPGNALNTKERLLHVAPGTARTLWVSYSLQD
jgi:galactose mutarotase-like enzyme